MGIEYWQWQQDTGPRWVSTVTQIDNGLGKPKQIFGLVTHCLGLDLLLKCLRPKGVCSKRLLQAPCSLKTR
jgi:hypothetical protein